MPRRPQDGPTAHRVNVQKFGRWAKANHHRLNGLPVSGVIKAFGGSISLQVRADFCASQAWSLTIPASAGDQLIGVSRTASSRALECQPQVRRQHPRPPGRRPREVQPKSR